MWKKYNNGNTKLSVAIVHALGLLEKKYYRIADSSDGKIHMCSSNNSLTYIVI